MVVSVRVPMQKKLFLVSALRDSIQAFRVYRIVGRKGEMRSYSGFQK